MRIGKFGIVPLLCTLLLGFVPKVAAQAPEDECDHLVQTVFDQAERDDVNQPDVLQSIVGVARQARDCYGDQRRPDRIAWLLTNEVFALDLLRRYDEARAAIDLFFSKYVNDASDLFKGKFFQWRLLYHIYEGQYDDAAVAYDSAQQYDRALTLAQRAVLRNDGAVLAIRREDFEEAIKLATAGIALLDSTYRLRDEGVIFARLLQNRGHARLARSSNDSASVRLDPAVGDLISAIALRDSLGFTERQAEAHVTLGEIYHGLGDGPAGRGYMGQGLGLARDGGNPRGEIFALWRMGRLNRRGRLVALAREQLQMALDISKESGIGEFELFILLELGRLYEDREAWKRAEGFYRVVIETPNEARYRSTLYDAAKARDEAERRSMTMRAYIAEAESARDRLRLFGAGLVILLLIVGYVWDLRRRGGLPQVVPPLLTRFPDTSGDDRLDNRLRHLREILEREDPAFNSALYRILDDEVTGERSRGDAAERYRKYFKARFRKLGIAYPETPGEWRRLLLPDD